MWDTRDLDQEHIGTNSQSQEDWKSTCPKGPTNCGSAGSGRPNHSTAFTQWDWPNPSCRDDSNVFRQDCITFANTLNTGPVTLPVEECHTRTGEVRTGFSSLFTAMHSNKDTKTESWQRNWCVRSNHSQKSFCKNEFVTEDCVSASLCWALWKKSKWFAWTLAKYYLNFLQVYERLQTLNLTMSISSTRRLVKTLGTGYDQKVKNWRDLLATTLSVRNKSKQ